MYTCLPYSYEPPWETGPTIFEIDKVIMDASLSRKMWASVLSLKLKSRCVDSITGNLTIWTTLNLMNIIYCETPITVIKLEAQDDPSQQKFKHLAMVNNSKRRRDSKNQHGSPRWMRDRWCSPPWTTHHALILSSSRTCGTKITKLFSKRRRTPGLCIKQCTQPFLPNYLTGPTKWIHGSTQSHLPGSHCRNTYNLDDVPWPRINTHHLILWPHQATRRQAKSTNRSNGPSARTACVRSRISCHHLLPYYLQEWSSYHNLKVTLIICKRKNSNVSEPLNLRYPLISCCLDDDIKCNILFYCSICGDIMVCLATFQLNRDVYQRQWDDTNSSEKRLFQINNLFIFQCRSNYGLKFMAWYINNINIVLML